MSRDRRGDRTQEVVGSSPISSTKTADFPDAGGNTGVFVVSRSVQPSG